jgi:hypothetical protein
MSEGRELKIKVDNVGVLETVKEQINAKNEAENRAKELEKLLADKEAERLALEEQLTKLQGGGSGVLPASLNSGEGGNSNVPTGTHEFDSYEEMVEWARLNDRTVYEQLKKKSVNGLMENKQFFEWHDTFDAQGRSLIGRTLDRANNQKRSRIK